MAGPRRVANDPERRERIVAAALDVIVENGVHRTTHRRIAAAAGVPLGSLTYYFADLTEIIEAAFRHVFVTWSGDMHRALEQARSPEQAQTVVVDMICGVTHASTPEIIGLFELYSFGNHNAAVGAIRRDWLLATRESLMLHFTEPTVRALDALIEGWPMHRVFEANRSIGTWSNER